MAINTNARVYGKIQHWSQAVATVYHTRKLSDTRKRTGETPLAAIEFHQAMGFVKKFTGPIRAGKKSYREEGARPEPSDIFAFTNQAKLLLDGVVVDEVKLDENAEEGVVDKSKVMVVELAEPRGVRVITLAEAFAKRSSLIPYLFKSTEVESLP
jgi:hypothetical protein